MAHWALANRFGIELGAVLDLPSAYRECVDIFAWTHGLAHIDDGGGNYYAKDGTRDFDAYTAEVFPHLARVQWYFIPTDGISTDSYSRINHSNRGITPAAA